MPTVGSYYLAMQALLPTGPAWPREKTATLSKLLLGFAEEFGRLDDREAQLLREADPRTATELLDAWETTLGLPDACTTAATQISARRLAAWRKLALVAGQTPAFYIALAAALGFEVEVHDLDPHVDDYDSSLTPLITGGRWRFVWRVHVLSATDYTVFRVGASSAGDRLVDGGAIDLECVITAARPAHTHVIFTYED